MIIQYDMKIIQAILELNFFKHLQGECYETP